jgi:hypothetical protein
LGLTSRSSDVACPSAYWADSAFTAGQLLRVALEEEGSLWLWYSPDLLVWPRPVTWLFSPVVGRSWPGDLWGMDETGELLIVEAKRIVQHRRTADPLADFIDAGRADEAGQPPFGTDDIERRWRYYYARELSLPAPTYVGPKGVSPGVLPYSVHRRALNTWTALAGVLSERLRSPSYENAVDAALEARRRGGDQMPHYVGLFVLASDAPAKLSARGTDSWRRLVDAAGISHVHLRSVWAERLPTLSLRLTGCILPIAGA